MRNVFMVAACGLFIWGVQAQDLSITSFQSSGHLAWSNSVPGSHIYQIEWSSIPNGPWTNTWGHLTNIESTQAINSVEVPMFYRVVLTGTTVADSVRDYSATQGSSNWFYGYYTNSFTPSCFVRMTNFVGNSWYVSSTRYWTRLGPTDAHPNGTITSQGRQAVEQWAVRRWVSNIAGPVTIRGVISDDDVYSDPVYENGVIVHVFIGGVEKGHYTIDRGGSTTFSISATLANGTILDFALDPQGSNDHYDRTTFRIVIAKPAQ